MSEAKGTWRRVPLRHLAEFNPTIPSAIRNSDASLPLFPMDAIREFSPPSDPEVRPANTLLQGYSYLDTTDVAYAKVTPCFENGKGVIGTDLEGPSFATTEVTVLRPRSATLQCFLAYALQSSNFRSQAIASMTGSGGLKRVSEPEMKSFKLPIPDLGTQRTIVDHLDREIAEIDALISECRGMHDLLAERREASLNRTLSSVPARMAPLKRFGTLQSGLTLGKDYRGQETLHLPYLRVANVQAGTLDLSDVKSVAVPPSIANTVRLAANDVLITEGGDRDKLGRGALWEGQIDPILHQNHVFAFRCGPRLDPRYLVYVLEGRDARIYFDLTARQSTNLASTNSSIVLSFPLPVPDRAEQSTIVRRLDDELRLQREEATELEIAITLARERRAALITAAVTGQIDVTAKRRPAAEQLEDDIKELS